MVKRQPKEAINSWQWQQPDIAHNTMRAYLADLKHFVTWGGSIPTDIKTLLIYLQERAAWDAVSTIKRRIMAIRYAHIRDERVSPTDDPQVKVLLRNIKRKYGVAQKQAKPLLRKELRAIVRAMDRSTRDLRDRALLLVGFTGAFRRSELIGLDVKDLERVPEGFLINLRKSKTDQEHRGRVVAIPMLRTSLCPVSALERWLRTAQIDDGAIFQRLSRSGIPTGVRLDGAYVSVVVKSRLESIGINADAYSAHSLRAGLVTEAVKAGTPIHRIMQQTGHKTDSMVRLYSRDTDLWSGNAAVAACRG